MLKLPFFMAMVAVTFAATDQINDTARRVVDVVSSVGVVCVNGVLDVV